MGFSKAYEHVIPNKQAIKKNPHEVVLFSEQLGGSPWKFRVECHNDLHVLQQVFGLNTLSSLLNFFFFLAVIIQ